MNMTDTKEKILITALHLFARDGFEAVSVSTIAGELGMTKGALYKHYANKRDIFNTMIQRMFDLDQSVAQKYGMPEQNFNVSTDGYDSVDLAYLKNFTLAQFRFWTEDDFASSIRRMLSLEQYRSEEMGRIYQEMVVSGPVQYLADLFRAMMNTGRMKVGDAHSLAVEFYSPLYLLIAMSDNKQEERDPLAVLEGLVDSFIGRWRV
jgi:AcrR family transcriptional regulator